MPRYLSQIACAAFICASPAAADLRVVFTEGAPKDVFTITQDADCLLEGRLVIELGSALSGLIFDTSTAGQGFAAAQPFEVVAGSRYLSEEPMVLDGDTGLSLWITALPAGEVVAFSIDIDNTVGTRGLTVSGAEIAGATVVFTRDGQRTAAAFDTSSVAQMPLVGCGDGGT